MAAPTLNATILRASIAGSSLMAPARRFGGDPLGGARELAFLQSPVPVPGQVCSGVRPKFPHPLTHFPLPGVRTPGPYRPRLSAKLHDPLNGWKVFRFVNQLGEC